ncbi:unnamed protein product, partial [Brassica oleracea var. botrytis]
IPHTLLIQNETKSERVSCPISWYVSHFLVCEHFVFSIWVEKTEIRHSKEHGKIE